MGLKQPGGPKVPGAACELCHRGLYVVHLLEMPLSA